MHNPNAMLLQILEGKVLLLITTSKKLPLHLLSKGTSDNQDMRVYQKKKT